MKGRLVERKSGIAANGSLQIGSSYRPGTYTLEILQGNERRILRLIKGSQ